MPLLGTRGVASALGFGFAGASGIGAPYWIEATYKSGVTLAGKASAIDASGNVYALIQDDGTYSYTATTVVKYSPAGAILWQTDLSYYVAVYGNAIALDSSGNCYVAGQISTSPSQGLIAKFNSSGVLQWQKTVSDSYGIIFRGIAVDSSSNIYAVGYHQGNISCVFGSHTFVVKLSSSGTLTWQRKYYSSPYSGAVGQKIVFDSSQNLVVIGDNSGYACVWKINASTAACSAVGAYSTSANYYTISSGGVDSSGNIYIAGSLNVNTGCCNTQTRGFVVKLNSGLTLQASKALYTTTVGSTTNLSALAADSVGNVWVTGYNDSIVSGSYVGVLAQLDSSFALSKKSYLYNSQGSATYTLGLGVSTDISNNVYVSAQASGANPTSALAAKLPSDGSKLGTYLVSSSSPSVNMQYATISSISYVNVTFTTQGVSNNTFTPSASVNSGGLTNSTSTYTRALATL